MTVIHVHVGKAKAKDATADLSPAMIRSQKAEIVTKLSQVKTKLSQIEDLLSTVVENYKNIGEDGNLSKITDLLTSVKAISSRIA